MSLLRKLLCPITSVIAAACSTVYFVAASAAIAYYIMKLGENYYWTYFYILVANLLHVGAISVFVAAMMPYNCCSEPQLDGSEPQLYGSNSESPRLVRAVVFTLGVWVVGAFVATPVVMLRCSTYNYPTLALFTFIWLLAVIVGYMCAVAVVGVVYGLGECVCGSRAPEVGIANV